MYDYSSAVQFVRQRSDHHFAEGSASVTPKMFPSVTSLHASHPKRGIAIFGMRLSPRGKPPIPPCARRESTNQQVTQPTDAPLPLSLHRLFLSTTSLFSSTSSPLSLHSSLLLLYHHLRIHRRGAKRTDIPSRRFVEVRLPNLAAVRAADRQGFVGLGLGHGALDVCITTFSGTLPQSTNQPVNKCPSLASFSQRLQNPPHFGSVTGSTPEHRPDGKRNSRDRPSRTGIRGQRPVRSRGVRGARPLTSLARRVSCSTLMLAPVRRAS